MTDEGPAQSPVPAPLRKIKPFKGPQQFVFKDPDTGRMFHAHTRESLIRDIHTYRDQNNLPPIEYLNIVLENYWCSLPENAPNCQPSTELTRSFYQYLKGTIALVQSLAYPKKAPLHIANQRALQCSTCPYNVFPDRSQFIQWSDAIAEQCLGPHTRSEHHNALGNCEVCSCPLRAKVFWDRPLSPFPEDQVTKLREVSCWQLKLSNQDKP